MLKSLEINGFKSFGNKSRLTFDAPISAIVGPNGSGKSNAAEAFRFVLGEQSLKALRARNTDELLFNGGQEGQRRNRAHVKAVFDNSEDYLDIDYDEVVVERIIQRGDASTYRINGSQVRLKDVIDLLSDANIGTSRHHIISQGEADRILNIHERERKSMIEDALGLRRFYRRRREAMQKLTRTEENLTQIKSRRSDLVPELKFLSKQKERIEKTKKLRSQLTNKYQRYFKRESILLERREKKLIDKQESLKNKSERLSEQITEAEKTLEVLNQQLPDRANDQVSDNKLSQKLEETEEKLSQVIEECGQVEGRLQALREQQAASTDTKEAVVLSEKTISHHREIFQGWLDRAEQAENNQSLFDEIKTILEDFLSEITKSDTVTQNFQPDINKLENEQQRLKKKQANLKDLQSELRKKQKEEQEEQRDQQSKLHEAEKDLLQLQSTLENINAERERVTEQLSDLTDRQEQLTDEKSEASILCGKSALETSEALLVNTEGKEITEEELLQQTNRRSEREYYRQLERLKIKLENTRVADETEVMNEYDRVESQVAFLDGEIEDLQESKEALLELINDIEATVAEKFDHGIAAINKAFSDFFQTMFGGGDAELFITKHPEGGKSRVEDMEETPDEIERGVGINIKLPNKKVRGLGVLSGGERSLVSIALLFALSQINPPPFVVLDEADAALDEANSKRFGNMINRLSQRSQLIIITHNRETMSRADVLYGVTMDQSGGSRLLSLNFSEAVDTVEA